MPYPAKLPGAVGRRPPIPLQALFAASLALIVAGCASTQSAEPAPMDRGVTVNDITRSPYEVRGQSVTVSGEVNRVYGTNMFSIGGDDFLEGAELLVLGPSTLPAVVAQGEDTTELLNDIVQVTGTVRIYDEDKIEEELGIDIDDDLFEPLWDDRPVIIAREIDLTERTDIVPVAVLTPALEAIVIEPIIDEMIIVDAPDPMKLAGRAAALIGVKVQTVVGDHAFWVGPDPNRRLFVAIDPDAKLNDEHMKIEPGQTVAVAGVLKAMPADLSSMQSEWSLSSANIETLKQERVYLDAQRTEILDTKGMGSVSVVEP